MRFRGWLLPVLLIVMHRSCSSCRVSVRRMSPAASVEMMPAAATSESVSVLLPWSTCAMTDRLRMLCLRSICRLNSSTVNLSRNASTPSRNGTVASSALSTGATAQHALDHACE